MSEETTHAARDGRTDGSREADGVWVELGESEAYWTFRRKTP